MRSIAIIARALCAALVPFVAAGCAQIESVLGPNLPEQRPDVVYDPTPPAVVDAMLELGEVKPGDVLYDLGSGDGRIVIAAAKRYGIRAVGVEIDAGLVARARENAKQAGVTGLVDFRSEDLFAADFGEASVVTLFLGAELNLRLRPRLLETLKPGTRIVSHQYDMGQWQPEATRRVAGRELYLWRVPVQMPEQPSEVTGELSN